MKHLHYFIKIILLALLCLLLPSTAFADDAKHTLKVVSKPEMAGTFNTNTATLAQGEVIHLFAYANSNFTFKEWTAEDGTVVATAQDFEYTMPDRDVTLTAVYDYNPANPTNPAANVWDAKTGNVIIDEFAPGSLSGAIAEAIGQSRSSEVLMITVAGRMNNNDFNVTGNYSNCTLFDISRVTGITEVPSYAFDYTKLESVYLPASIEKIGYNAFYDCRQLQALTIYAMMPPVLENNVFQGVPDGLVVYVPAAAIAQYQDAEGWKDFTILPIQEDIRTLTVTLPQNAKAADYSQMWLELTNTKNGQKMHYVMTDRTAYTFANIIRHTSWNVVLRNQRGDVFGKIDNIEVKDEDVSVTFSNLSRPQSVSLSVLSPEGNDVTTQCQVTWLDATGAYFAQATSLSGMLAGTKLAYSVALPQELAMRCAIPVQTEYVVKETGNNVQCRLSDLGQVVLTGKVKDTTTGMPLSGAAVSASQTFGGKYSKTVSAKTDASGKYTLTISNVPTSLAISASDYISQTLDTNALMDGASSTIVVPEVALKPISGAVIALNLTYTKCPTTADDEDTFLDWYSDYNNVAYSIYNQTKQRAISQFNVQYPQIVLLEDVNEGDVLQLTATSKTGAFMPVVATATIDAEQRANAAFNIVELGKIKATFAKNANASVAATLYDAKGKLVLTGEYINGTLTISNLTDGHYSLVTMGSSRLFNTIYDLAQLPQTGLVRLTDYVQHNVEVKSGEVTNIDIDEVPTLNESKLYYTGDNTSFTVNKSSIVAGNYLTLTGHLDFKSAYATNVNNVNLIVDLPESCQFVENSVMVGNATSSYTLDGHRLTIPMARYTDRVRFCIIPTLGGDYAPSALAQFDIDGVTVTQPIGAASYTAKDLSITVPSTVAKTTIPVSGTAIGASAIDIYDGDVLIGQTSSLANGTWSTTCELYEPYNLSTHNIHAQVTTKAGLELQSENVECLFNKSVDLLKSVTMSFYNEWLRKQVSVEWDFLNNTTDVSSYMFYHETDFTFLVDFTNNDTTRLRDVVVNVYTTLGDVVEVPVVFNSALNKWCGTTSFNSSNLPVNVSVDYCDEPELLADRNKIENDLSTAQDNYLADVEFYKSVAADIELLHQIEVHDKDLERLGEILSSDIYDEDELSALMTSIVGDDIGYDDGFEDTEDIDETFALVSEQFDRWLQENTTSKLFESFGIPLSILNDVQSFDESEYTNRIDLGSYTLRTTSILNSSEEELLQQGFVPIHVDDSTCLYYLINDSSFIVVDGLKKVKHEYLFDNVENSQSSYRVQQTPISTFAFPDFSFATKFLSRLEDFNDEKGGFDKVISFVSEWEAFISGLETWYEQIYTLTKEEFYARYGDELKGIDSNIEYSNRQACTWRKLISENVEEWSNLKKDEIKIRNKIALSKDPKEIAQLNEQLAGISDKIELAKLRHDKLSNYLNKTLESIEVYKRKRKVIENIFKRTESLLQKIPIKLTPTPRLHNFLKIGGKVIGGIGVLIEVYAFYSDFIESYENLKRWVQLANGINSKIPCLNNEQTALSLRNDIYKDGYELFIKYKHILFAEWNAIKIDVLSLSGAKDRYFALACYFTSGALNIYAEWSKLITENEQLTKLANYYIAVNNLRCGDKQDKDKTKSKKSRHGDISPIHDPSGFVYEGVFSNRLEGVTATAYYKEEVEDMYGDIHENIVKWDAAEYAQENPLFTDENGYYRWDVPQGMWQVKFEKEGYETTYSEWLPVPPPQLDVNIAMKQNVQPNVKNARAYKDAVEVEFDKYMMPELLTTDNVAVMANGKPVSGSVVMLNEEVSYEGSNERYASKIRFNAATPFAADEVTLIVNNRVKSYAGIRMQDDYSQTFSVEPELRTIEVTDNITVPYGNAMTIFVTAKPASAAAGKTLRVQSSSKMIASVNAETVQLDKNGKAEITIFGELPGTAGITFTVDGYDIKTATVVNVKIAETTDVAAPKASLASGSVVEKGTAVTLTSDTPDVTIYYTKDGSCPCDEASRIVYTAPIIIDHTMKIRAIAVAVDLTESDVVEFSYYVEGDDGIEDVTLDETIKVYPLPVRDKLNVTAGGEVIKSVTLVSTNGSVVAKAAKPETIVTLDVSTLAPGIYFINVATEDKNYSRKIMKVE